MKILYVTNHYSIAYQNGGYYNDYLNDLVFYGLRELYGDNVVDSTPIVTLYQENINKINPKNLWGGMTAVWLIGKNNINRIDIEDKIKDKYFDLIIYGSIWRCNDYYEDLVSKIYDPKKVIIIDGADQTTLNPIYKKHLYFKRELIDKHPNLLPITFSIPTCKLATPDKNKIQNFGTVIPYRSETYIFKNELDYYKDYQKSYYGVTTKKGGWDCMRHYEILGNYCLPYFIGLEDCPNNILFNFPKELLLDAKHIAHNFDLQKYFNILDEVFEYTKQNLTTKNIAEYIISKI
jgi:hypothetical protein